MDDETFRLELKKPIKADKQEWRDLDLVEPTVAQVMTAEKAGVGTTLLLALIHEVAKVPVAAAKQMATSDGRRANAFFMRFADPGVGFGDDDDEATIVLTKPIGLKDGQVWTELRLAEPTVGEWAAAQSEGGQGNAVLLALISTVAKVPQAVLKAMLWSDFQRADKFFARYELDKPSAAANLSRSAFFEVMYGGR